MSKKLEIPGNIDEAIDVWVKLSPKLKTVSSNGFIICY